MPRSPTKFPTTPSSACCDFAGILSKEEKAALDALSADAAYRSAVNDLATQPGLVAPPDERIWLLDADLQFPLRDLLAQTSCRLPRHKALAYLSKTLSENAVVQRSAAELGIDRGADAPLAHGLCSAARPAAHASYRRVRRHDGRGGLCNAQDHVRWLVLGDPGRQPLNKWKLTVDRVGKNGPID